MTMSDAIDRAGRVVSPVLSELWESNVTNWGPEARDIVRALADAGLLVTPEHDRAVAARAWREGFTTGQSRAMRHMSDEPLLPLSAPNPYEREGCAS